MQKKNIETKLEFHGGMLGLAVPFVILFGGIIYLALSGKAIPMAFWVPALAALLAALVMSKDRTQTADCFAEGMSDRIVSIMIMAWFLAGIVSELLQATGLIEGLIWLSTSIGLKGRFFPVITFFVGSLLSTATGTALGTVIALTPILYPVGVSLGANPPVMLAAIVSAAYFGDNIAPVSDTTIASAYTQGVEVSEVVKSRLKYAFVAAAMAAVGFFIFGGSSTGVVGAAEIGDLSSKGLIMLLVPALLIAMMYKGVNLIVALVSANTFGIVLGLVTGLLEFSSLLIIDMDSFAVGGILVDGIMGLIDITVFALLLMGLINLLRKGGFFEALINALSRYTKTPRSAEATMGILNIILNMLTVANSVVIVMQGPVAKEILVEQHNITPDRSANILDTVSCSAMALIPYGFAPLLAYMFATGSGTPVDFSILQVSLYSFHGWALLVVMIFSIWTGWGRTFSE